MMHHQLLIVVLAFAVTPAWAVNKCKGADGKVVYQDSACAANEVGEALKFAQPNGTGESKQLPFKSVILSSEEARNVAAAGMAIAKQRLKDPDSAKFANVRSFSFSARGKTFAMTCGDLNAKNSYGGYVGSKPFWVYDGMYTETYNHYLPGTTATWLMGDAQAACLRDGTPAL